MNCPRASEVTYRKLSSRTMRSGIVTMLFLFSLTSTAPLFSQTHKLSEKEIRQAANQDSTIGANVPLTVLRAPAGRGVSDQYVVLFKSSVARPHQAARGIVEEAGGRLLFMYAHAVKGFAAILSPEAVEKLRHDPRVALIEEDRSIPNAALTSMRPEAPLAAFPQAAAIPTPLSPQIAPPWGLDRIDQRNLPLDNSFSFPANGGAGVHIYIIDSGILGGIFGLAGAHVEFEGRVGDGFDAITPGGNANDCNGHGTFVASLAAGTTLGVAKLATLHPVNVLGCSAGGTASTIIAGVNWVTSDHLAHPGQKSVANASFTISQDAGPDPAVDQAVQNSINAGIVYTIAAGNFGPKDTHFDSTQLFDLANSCNLSPQRVGAAITVGEMDDTNTSVGTVVPDTITLDSSTGGCVDLYAPGVEMTGASIASTTAITGPPLNKGHFGTSYSAPLAAGVAALYLAANPNANPSQVASAITSNATNNVLTFADPTSFGGPNRLLYSDFQTDIQTGVSSNLGAPAVGAQIKYTFIVHNNGPYNTMDSVLFTDNLPVGVSLVGGAATSVGSCSGTTTISCNLGRLAVGQQAVISISVTVPFTPQSFTNTGTATLQSGQTDRTPSNNSASLTLTTH